MSTLVLDTITGKSTATTITIGSTPVVSASANSMTIRGEGSAQTSIQGGLTKAWVNLNGTGTIAIRDSLNVTSCSDDGTGQYTVTIANNMANTNYATTSGMARSGLSSCSFLADGSWAATTGSHACICANNGNSAVDVYAMLASFLGDLA